jgi:carboxymethylenebutenolidase
MGELIDLGGAATAANARGYLATPEKGAGPGLVVIQEYWGLVPHIEELCDRFAGQGFSALAPDLLRGATADEPDEADKLMMALNLQQAAADMGSAVDYLRSSPAVRGDGIGVVGFCMGGGLALMLAAQRPADIDACVAFYGLIPWESASPDWTTLDAPVQGHFGEDDDFFSPEKMRDLQASLDRADKTTDFHLYAGAGHAFFNDTRPEAYDESAAALAWTRTLEFLRAKLG